MFKVPPINFIIRVSCTVFADECHQLSDTLRRQPQIVIVIEILDMRLISYLIFFEKNTNIKKNLAGEGTVGAGEGTFLFQPNIMAHSAFSARKKTITSGCSLSLSPLFFVTDKKGRIIAHTKPRKQK